jgi:hypothetical protein
MNDAWPGGEHEEHPGGGHAVGDRDEVVLGGPVHPVEILEHAHRGMDLGRAHREPPHGGEDLAAPLLGVHGRDRRIAGIERQHVPQIGKDRPEVLAEDQHRALDLPGRALLATAQAGHPVASMTPRAVGMASILRSHE